MSKRHDIRWEQRFSNYAKAFNKFEEAVNYIKQNYLDGHTPEESQHLGDILNDILKLGLIQSFEYTHELAWNVMKDYAAYQGNVAITGSRDAIREAFSNGLISNGKIWMDMIISRNKTSHTYNEETADEIFRVILEDYHPALKTFLEKMETLRSAKQGDIFEE
ncbi:nucleotidyltransferase substrate binding protein [Galbibacter sp.]|uniref:nucleotidyltransferase substrate binding protein n=1 Tax=Galbibacter sp. TaxID=2918471 RepID=UPI003A947916